jgi:hypothetical protein
MLSTYESFADAYVAGLTEVLRKGSVVAGVVDSTSIGSSFGKEPRPTRELRPFGFQVRDPRQALLRCPARQPDLGFAFGQWLWVMRGSDELDTIAYYNSMGRLFSDDGRRLRNAFGTRIGGGPLDAAVALLRRDPSSRRAMLVFGDSAGPAIRTRDSSCAISLQFLIREGRLEAITNMRSQSALMVLPYDAALFMTIHVWVAALLDVPIGSHTWIANSFHLYEDEVALAGKVLEGPVTSLGLPPVGDPHLSLSQLLRFEHQLRTAAECGNASEVSELEAAVSTARSLEGAIRAVLLAHARRRLGQDQQCRRALSQLPAGWGECLPKPQSTLVPTR